MAKYIDAEALKRDLIDNRGFFPAIVAKAIEDAPAVDVVQVVKCKDCKDWQRNSGFAEHSPTGYCFFIEGVTLAGDYCSYAERKD